MKNRYILLLSLLLIVSAAQAETLIRASAGGDKPIPGQLPVLSNSIKLYGAPGEALNFIVKLKTEKCGPIAAVLNGEPQSSREPQFNFFLMPGFRIEHKSHTASKTGIYYDPLIPAGFARICPKDTGEWIWGEVLIPEDQQPGDINYTVRFAGEGDLKLKLKIWDLKFDSKPALPAYMEMTTWYNLLGHYGKWHDGEGELGRKYRRFLHRHRVETLTTHVAVPPVIGDGDFVRLDLDKQPTHTQSFRYVNLKERPLWSYFGFPTVPVDKAFEPESIKYYRAIANTARIKGREGKALIYLWDEPQPQDYPKLKSFARLVKSQAPQVKLLVTMPYNKTVADEVDIFVPVMDEYESSNHPAPEVYQRLQKEGKGVWWYVSCMSHGCDALGDSGTPDFVIDRPASYIRSIGWLSRRYRVDAFLYYHVNYAYQFYPKRDLWKDQWDFSGNGDGTILYPGRKGEHGLSAETPLASIRLKLWREASFDAEYIRLMQQSAKKPEWWKQEFKALTRNTRKWSRDYSAYQKLRTKMGEWLTGEGRS